MRTSERNSTLPRLTWYYVSALFNVPVPTLEPEGRVNGAPRTHTFMWDRLGPALEQWGLMSA